MKTLVPAAAAVLIALSFTAPVAARPSASPEDCAFYEAAYEAVTPLLAENRPRGKDSVFASMTVERAHDPKFGRRQTLEGEKGPILDLAACPALAQRIASGGAPTKFSRPPVLLQVDGPTLETFSRTATKDGAVHVTYYLGRDAGIDLVLRRGADGSWSVEKAQAWETIVLT